MSQSHHDIYLLDGETKTYIYTTDKHVGTKNLLKELGFVHQFTVYSYGWSVTEGYMFSLLKYLDLTDKDRMLRLVRISNGTDAKIHEMHTEVSIAETVARKRWWQYYRIKK